MCRNNRTTIFTCVVLWVLFEVICCRTTGKVDNDDGDEINKVSEQSVLVIRRAIHDPDQDRIFFPGQIPKNYVPPSESEEVKLNTNEEFKNRINDPFLNANVKEDKFSENIVIKKESSNNDDLSSDSEEDDSKILYYDEDDDDYSENSPEYRRFKSDMRSRGPHSENWGHNPRHHFHHNHKPNCRFPHRGNPRRRYPYPPPRPPPTTSTVRPTTTQTTTSTEVFDPRKNTPYPLIDLRFNSESLGDKKTKDEDAIIFPQD